MTTRFVQINPTLFLLEQEVQKPSAKTPEPVGGINHIYIVDRSGSMHNLLRGLGDDLIGRYHTLKPGDTITYGWFSSPGDYRFVLKGFKVTADPKDFDVFAKTVRDNLDSRGTTCFSEILGEVPSVVKDLKAFGPLFALTFFTDGYPVVPNYDAEIKAIRSAIEKVKGEVAAALLVGYGNYYNRDLMAQMTEWVGGSFVHARDLGTFAFEMTQFMEGVQDLNPRVEVALDNTDPLHGLVFAVQNKNVVMMEPQLNKVLFTPYKAKQNFLYTLSKTRPADGKEVTLTDSEVKSNSSVEQTVKAMYAAAMLLNQRCETVASLDVLGRIGDVAAIDAINNAYTNDEHGRAEALIAQSLIGPSKRFSKGRNLNYLPDPNAFCILDLLEMMNNDPSAKLWPRHDAFDYNRIGTKTAELEGTLKFSADKNIQTPIDGLVWNQTMLNLSVRAKITGHVELPAEAEKFGLMTKFPTYIYRAYTVIKDGFLNIPVLPVTLSQQNFEALKVHGVVDADVVYPANADEPVLLHLDRIPVINRRIGESKNRSVTDLCRSYRKEIALAGTLKALNGRLSEIGEYAPSLKKELITDDTKAFLESCGITSNGFDPARGATIKTGDFYMAKEFEIKIKGMSSLPKVQDVKDKIAAWKQYNDELDRETKSGSKTATKLKAPKPLTAREEIVADGIKLLESLYDTHPKVEKARIEAEIARVKSELYAIRRYLRETMFSILLAKQWFAEFTSREENSIEVDGDTFLISLKNVRVDL